MSKSAKQTAKAQSAAETLGTAFDRGTAVATLRELYVVETSRVRQAFESGRSNARQAADWLTVITDEMLQDLWHQIAQHYGVDLAEHLALLAVGGYGRGQLAPHSDLDLLFLRVSNDSALQDRVVEDMLYVLWDLKLKVGQATRTPRECLRLGTQDPTILTSLLDLRLIRGSRRGFSALRQDIDRRLLAPRRAEFVSAKIEERSVRHRRSGDSYNALEPNVKESRGGLRDLHALSWVARAVFGDGQVSTLMARGVFSKAQATDFERAEAFLLAVRFHLHYLLGRAEERLFFDVQQDIAGAMGFEPKDGRSSVEMFMQTYFRHAREVGALSGLMISIIEEEFEAPRQAGLSLLSLWRPSAVVPFEGFARDKQRLSIQTAQQLIDRPIDFLRYFMVLHSHDLSPAPATLRLISQNLRLIDAQMQALPEANALFLDLLCHEKNPRPILALMNDTGVLAAFLPEWAHVVGLMQFNRYHAYTVDEHTLRAVEQLHLLRAVDLGEGTLPVHETFAHIDDMQALFVAMLYHDIAKGREGKHEIEGAKRAPAVCKRLGLNAEQTDRVTWLIREHLSLSDMAFQRDLDDPETLESIAEMGESLDALRMLYVLTAADIRAVAPDTWTPWKASLLTRAFRGGGDVLRVGEVGGQSAERAQVARLAFVEAMEASDQSKAETAQLAGFLNASPESYWLTYDTPASCAHFALFQSAPKVEILPLRRRVAAEVRVCMDDAPGLFARIAAGIALAGWNVVATKAHTFSNGLAIDTFFVEMPSAKQVPKPSELEALTAAIEQALDGKQSLADMSKRLTRKRTKRQSAMDRPATVRIEQPKNPRSPTLIEVTGPDRPALLFDLSAQLLDLGLMLKSVQVATYGERFVNVFAVTDLLGQRLSGDDRLARVLQHMKSAAERKT